MIAKTYTLTDLSGHKIPHSAEHLELDHSMRECYDECPRKYFFQYIKHQRGQYGSTALRLGSVIHAMLEGYYDYILKNGWNDLTKATAAGIDLGKKVWDSESEGMVFQEDYRTLEVAIIVFMKYVKHYELEAGFTEILGTEDVFEVVMGPETPEEKVMFKDLHPYLYMGKVDKKSKVSELLTITDHKTSSAPLITVEKLYRRSPQPIGYTYGEYQYHGKMPAQTTMNLLYIAWLKTKPRKVEDGMYAIPLGDDKGTLKVQFARFPNSHTPFDLHSWRLSCMKDAMDIQWNMKSGLWPMQYRSCANIYGFCSYLDLCEQNRPFHELNLNGYIEKKWDPRIMVEKVEILKRDLVK